MRGACVLQSPAGGQACVKQRSGGGPRGGKWENVAPCFVTAVTQERSVLHRGRLFDTARCPCEVIRRASHITNLMLFSVRYHTQGQGRNHVIIKIQPAPLNLPPSPACPPPAVVALPPLRLHPPFTYCIHPPRKNDRPPRHQRRLQSARNPIFFVCSPIPFSPPLLPSLSVPCFGQGECPSQRHAQKEWRQASHSEHGRSHGDGEKEGEGGWEREGKRQRQHVIGMPANLLLLVPGTRDVRQARRRGRQRHPKNSRGSVGGLFLWLFHPPGVPTSPLPHLSPPS